MSEPQAVVVLAALGHELRFSLWRLLAPYGSRGLPAGTIAARMSVLPSSLSFHLRGMTQAGVLIQRRSSRQIIYAVNHDVINGLVESLTNPIVPVDTSADQASDPVGKG